MLWEAFHCGASTLELHPEEWSLWGIKFVNSKDPDLLVKVSGLKNIH